MLIEITTSYTSNLVDKDGSNQYLKKIFGKFRYN